MDRILLSSVVLTVILNWSSPASALVNIQDVGCYVIQGQISQVNGERILLTVSPKSRSEQLLWISVKGHPSPPIHPSDWIESVVFVNQTGDPSQARLQTQAKSVKKIGSEGLSASRNWTWVEDARGGKCP